MFELGHVYHHHLLTGAVQMLQFCAKSTRDAFVLREELPREVTRAVRTSYNRETRQVDARANSYHDRICSGSNQVGAVDVEQILQ